MGRRVLHIILRTVLTIFIFSTVAYAQLTEVEIKLSGNYYWGAGFGDSRENAISNAKRELIEKIQVRIESDATLSENASDDSYATEYRSKTNTRSQLELRGLNFLPPVEKPNGSWEVVAYLSKADFEESMKVEEDRLLSALDKALIDEKNGNLAASIPNMLDIYASTFFYPVPFYTDQERHGSKTELRAFLLSKARAWLNSSIIAQKKVRSLSTATNTELYIDFELTFRGNAVDNLYLKIDKPGYAQEPVRNGKVSIFTDIAPENAVQDYVFEIGIVIPDNMDQDKKAILEEILPSRELLFDVNFTDVIAVDFKTERKGNEFTFIPEVKNLNVYLLEWEFEQKETSTKTTPTYTFSSLDKGSLVKLVVNEMEDFTVIKRLNSSGKFINIETYKKVSRTQTVSETNDTETQVHFKVPFRLSSYINNIIRLPKYESLHEYLQRLAKEGTIHYGNAGMMPNPDKAYFVVIDPETRQAVTVVGPVIDGKRTNLRTEEEIDNSKLRDEFKGLGSLWFQFK